ncbi:hypothetical protein Tco_0825310 [Tanacetum coccineum]
MGTKVTSSSGSVLEEPEIQKLQMQAKIFKENSLNEKNALKSTTQLLDIQSEWYQEAFARLFGDSFRTFKFQLSHHMNNLETLLNEETLHEMDSKSALSVIKVQFERFINSDLLKPLDIYSRSFSSDREVIETFRDYTKMTAVVKHYGKQSSEHESPIQQCKVQEVQSTVTSSGDETSSGIVSAEEIDKQKLEAHSSYMARFRRSHLTNSSSTSQPLEQVQNYEGKRCVSNVSDILSNLIAALANLIANLTLDTEENKTILKQLKKANASLTQELKECKTNLNESSRALEEATGSRDSSLIALQTKQTELENRKDIDIQEGLKTKTYEISVVNQKHDELAKKSLLTRSQFEGQLKEKSKVISDLKVKEGKDIDTMIEMDKQIKSTFANPKYLKKAQSDKPRLYEIPYDTSDPANRFCPDGEETVTLEKESRSKLDKDTVKPYNLQHIKQSL